MQVGTAATAGMQVQPLAVLDRYVHADMVGVVIASSIGGTSDLRHVTNNALRRIVRRRSVRCRINGELRPLQIPGERNAARNIRLNSDNAAAADRLESCRRCRRRVRRIEGIDASCHIETKKTDSEMPASAIQNSTSFFNVDLRLLSWGQVGKS